MTEPPDIVGHKTFATGRIGENGFPELRHEPLTRAEADALMAAADAADAKRAADMPTEREALKMLFEAYLRLKELGWNDAIYCPKDGSEFDAIEIGSTGIHSCHYSGDWPNGSWWIAEAGDLWPIHPVLFRVKK